ncbi:hypothetical protein AQJ11_44980 [Streptomyces corchorusii]|jgi:hypothetical protein|uniref:Uncharacterized protein n=1 Tax=Streptomyces corchorusii TaxID=1903 RepID=A0A101PJH0_STRCK|nr:hypothetical protein AQJ11_44980 [Streptomyces corchorusii]
MCEKMANMPSDAGGFIGTLRWKGSDRREERIMIAKLLGKLCFSRHYGAYGAHEWDAYAGDDR